MEKGVQCSTLVDYGVLERVFVFVVAGCSADPLALLCRLQLVCTSWRERVWKAQKTLLLDLAKVSPKQARVFLPKFNVSVLKLTVNIDTLNTKWEPNRDLALLLPFDLACLTIRNFRHVSRWLPLIRHSRSITICARHYVINKRDIQAMHSPKIRHLSIDSQLTVSALPLLNTSFPSFVIQQTTAS
ncbi:hypothetical protein Pelo_7642 [Pelomyxa schiedti]|nr:hypothetical protein Pelo_7642 [Pelomyxa schiedti]